jgi:hypothetical protein
MPPTSPLDRPRVLSYETEDTDEDVMEISRSVSLKRSSTSSADADGDGDDDSRGDASGGDDGGWGGRLRSISVSPTLEGGWGSGLRSVSVTPTSLNRSISRKRGSARSLTVASSSELDDDELEDVPPVPAPFHEMVMPPITPTPKSGRHDNDVDEDVSSDLSSNGPISRAPGRSRVQGDNDCSNAGVDVDLSSDLFR